MFSHETNSHWKPINVIVMRQNESDYKLQSFELLIFHERMHYKKLPGGFFCRQQCQWRHRWGTTRVWHCSDFPSVAAVSDDGQSPRCRSCGWKSRGHQLVDPDLETLTNTNISCASVLITLLKAKNSCVLFL